MGSTFSSSSLPYRRAKFPRPLSLKPFPAQFRTAFLASPLSDQGVQPSPLPRPPPRPPTRPALLAPPAASDPQAPSPIEGWLKTLPLADALFDALPRQRADDARHPLRFLAGLTPAQIAAAARGCARGLELALQVPSKRPRGGTRAGGGGGGGCRARGAERGAAADRDRVDPPLVRSGGPHRVPAVRSRRRDGRRQIAWRSAAGRPPQPGRGQDGSGG